MYKEQKVYKKVKTVYIISGKYSTWFHHETRGTFTLHYIRCWHIINKYNLLCQVFLHYFIPREKEEVYENMIDNIKKKKKPKLLSNDKYSLIEFLKVNCQYHFNVIALKLRKLGEIILYFNSPKRVLLEFHKEKNFFLQLKKFMSFFENVSDNLN